MEDPALRPSVEQLYVTMGVYLGYALAQRPGRRWGRTFQVLK